MKYREFNLDEAINVAHTWADGATDDEVYAFVYEILEDVNWHSLNREIEAKFGTATAYGTNSPVSKIGMLVDWDIEYAAEVCISLLNEIGRKDIARFIETQI